MTRRDQIKAQAKIEVPKKIAEQRAKDILFRDITDEMLFGFGAEWADANPSTHSYDQKLAQALSVTVDERDKLEQKLQIAVEALKFADNYWPSIFDDIVLNNRKEVVEVKDTLIIPLRNALAKIGAIGTTEG